MHIELDREQYSGEALAGLGDLSHVEVLFYMNEVDPLKVEKTARQPRNNTDWPKVGIFSQRGKNRPNQIGLTICKFIKVDGKGTYNVFVQLEGTHYQKSRALIATINGIYLL